MKLKYYLRGIGVGLILAVAVYSVIIIPRKYRMTDEEVRRRAQELGMVQEEKTDVDLSALTATPAPEGEDVTPLPEGSVTPSPNGEDAAVQPPEGSVTPVPTGGNAANQLPEGSVTPVPTGEDTATPLPEGASTPVPDGSATTAPNGKDTAGSTQDAGDEPSSLTPEPTPDGQAPNEPDKPDDGTAPPTTAPEQDSPLAAPTTSAGGEKIALTVTYGMGSAEVARAAYRAGLIDDVDAFDRYLMQNGYALSIGVGTFSVPEGATFEEIARIVTRQ